MAIPSQPFPAPTPTSSSRSRRQGIEPIPEAGGGTADPELASLWRELVNYASLFTASLLTTYYGLGSGTGWPPPRSDVPRR